MIFRGIIDVSVFLQRDSARRPQWRYILRHLSALPIGEKDDRETCFPGAVRAGYDPDTILTQLKAHILRQSFPNGWITQTGGGIETLAAVPLTIPVTAFLSIVRPWKNSTYTLSSENEKTSKASRRFFRELD